MRSKYLQAYYSDAINENDVRVGVVHMYLVAHRTHSSCPMVAYISYATDSSGVASGPACALVWLFGRCSIHPSFLFSTLFPCSLKNKKSGCSTTAVCMYLVPIPPCFRTNHHHEERRKPSRKSRANTVKRPALTNDTPFFLTARQHTHSLRCVHSIEPPPLSPRAELSPCTLTAAVYPALD